MRDLAVGVVIFLGSALGLLVFSFLLPYLLVPPFALVALMGIAPWPTVPAVVLALGQFALHQQQAATDELGD